jgi:hypothetical protein
VCDGHSCSQLGWGEIAQPGYQTHPLCLCDSFQVWAYEVINNGHQRVQIKNGSLASWSCFAKTSLDNIYPRLNLEDIHVWSLCQGFSYHSSSAFASFLIFTRWILTYPMLPTPNTSLQMLQWIKEIRDALKIFISLSRRDERYMTNCIKHRIYGLDSIQLAPERPYKSITWLWNRFLP